MTISEELDSTPLPRPTITGPDMETPAAILVDIDGTIALHNGRGPFEYHKLGSDLPNWPVMHAVEALYFFGYDVVFMSGRPATWHNDTVRWIRSFMVNMQSFDGPFMRADGDYREDFVVKRELYDEHVKDTYYVAAVFDDRDQVVNMWRRDLGFTCFQVAEGAF